MHVAHHYVRDPATEVCSERPLVCGWGSVGYRHSRQRLELDTLGATQHLSYLLLPNAPRATLLRRCCANGAKQRAGQEESALECPTSGPATLRRPVIGDRG